MSKVKYDSKDVVLSRVYPFGKTNGDEKKPATIVTINELNGEDEETLYNEIEKGKLRGLAEISIATGLSYDEVKKLARKDIEKLLEELAGF